MRRLIDKTRFDCYRDTRACGYYNLQPPTYRRIECTKKERLLCGSKSRGRSVAVTFRPRLARADREKPGEGDRDGKYARATVASGTTDDDERTSLVCPERVT